MSKASQVTRINMAACIYLLTRAPRTASGVAELLGLRAETVRSYFTAMVDEGLAEHKDCVFRWIA